MHFSVHSQTLMKQKKAISKQLTSDLESNDFQSFMFFLTTKKVEAKKKSATLGKKNIFRLKL